MQTLIYRAAVKLTCPSCSENVEVPYTWIGTDFDCSACGNPWTMTAEKVSAIHAAFGEALVRVSQADERGDERPIGIADIGDNGTVRKPS